MKPYLKLNMQKSSYDAFDKKNLLNTPEKRKVQKQLTINKVPTSGFSFILSRISSS